jgi:hypothetical protein
MTSFLEHWAMSQNSWCILDAPLQSLKICGALHLFANLDVIFDLFPCTPPPPPPTHTHKRFHVEKWNNPKDSFCFLEKILFSKKDIFMKTSTLLQII